MQFVLGSYNKVLDFNIKNTLKSTDLSKVDNTAYFHCFPILVQSPAE